MGNLKSENHSSMQHAKAKERRELRCNLRNLQERARGARGLTDITNTQFNDIIQEAEKLHARVEKPREVAVDAELFRQMAEMSVEQAKRLTLSKKGRTASDLIAQLRQTYVKTHNPQVDGAQNSRAFNWSLMAQNAAHYFKEAPSLSCMLGALDVQAKVRKAPVRHKKDPVGELVAPKELQKIGDDSEKQETDRNMEEMFEVLEKVRITPFAELVCNCNSFGQTVENIFTLAFLVRDQKVRLVSNPETGLQVKALSKEQTAAASKKKPEDSVQFVYSFDLQRWALMKRIVGGQDNCLMRDRPSREEAAQAQLTNKKHRGALQDVSNHIRDDVPAESQKSSKRRRV